MNPYRETEEMTEHEPDHTRTIWLTILCLLWGAGFCGAAWTFGDVYGFERGEKFGRERAAFESKTPKCRDMIIDYSSPNSCPRDDHEMVINNYNGYILCKCQKPSVTPVH